MENDVYKQQRNPHFTKAFQIVHLYKNLASNNSP